MARKDKGTQEEKNQERLRDEAHEVLSRLYNINGLVCSFNLIMISLSPGGEIKDERLHDSLYTLGSLLLDEAERAVELMNNVELGVLQLTKGRDV